MLKHWSWQKSFKHLLCSCFIATALSSDISQQKNEILDLNSSQFIVNKINKISSNITVKIWDDRFLGSGTLIKKQNNIYEVVTNSHVLRIGNSPYRIQTFDGKFYQAKVVALTTKKSWDLALLTFKSATTNYKTANIGNSDLLAIGDYVFAAGFSGINEGKNTSQALPQKNRGQRESTDSLAEFSFNIGRVSLVLDKSLTAGYQIGSTNNIKKGMSGGPLLNERGELIGINGKHAYPLWEAPEFYEDGSQTCLPMQKLVYQNSWAIPIEKVSQFYREIELIPPDIDAETQRDFSLALIPLDSNEINPSEIIAEMQTKAQDAISCQN